jgi:amino acid transporter
MMNVECRYERSEIAFYLLAALCAIAFILTHAVAMVASVRHIMRNRLNEPAKPMWSDTLTVGIGMPLAVPIILFTLKPSMWMTELIIGTIRFIGNALR